MSAWKYIAKRYGMRIKAEFSPKTISVGTTAKKILDVNADRLFFIIVNNGSYAVFVGPHADVSTTKGLKIAPNGGTMISDIDNDGDLTLQEWWAISESGTNTLYVMAVEGETLG